MYNAIKLERIPSLGSLYSLSFIDLASPFLGVFSDPSSGYSKTVYQTSP